MAAVVAAPRARVWRALTDPAEIVRWDETRTALVDVDAVYPTPDQKVLWRTKLGNVALVLHERAQLVDPPERLALVCNAGSLHFEQLYALVEEPEDAAQAARTRVSLKIAARNRVQLIGADIDRFEVRRLLIARTDASLRALQKWCEAERPPQSDAAD